ncbi:MAG: hotdog fold thioesterase [Steroidobacteraceae bacterium]|jgi:1,4-dihydroxy-2-naphthoyl-CoA hydrolase|nr:hotdog fold thioesterase [Steroidobacteraceae bacterium]
MAERAPIWFRPYTLSELNAAQGDSMITLLGIEFTDLGPSHLTARMPVDSRTVQPFGLLHGGASVVLAETIGSTAAHMVVDSSRMQVVGQEINANHIRGVRSGHVTGTARPIHLGGRSQVWNIEIVDDGGRLACVSRLTLAVLDRHAQRLAP